MPLGAGPSIGASGPVPNGVSGFVRRRHHVSASAVWLSLLVSLSFVFHFFSAVFSPRFYVIALGIAVVGYVFSKPVSLSRFAGCRILPLALLAMGYSFWHSSRLTTAFADVLTLLLAATLALFPTRVPEDYRNALKCIVVWGVFFAAGILLASLARPLFNASLSLFPAAFSGIVRNASGKYTCGFSTNPGFSAGYITCAILALASGIRGRFAFSWAKGLLFAILGLALLFTGKRGHVLFLSLSMALCYLLPLQGKKKLGRYWNLFLVILFGIVGFYMMAEALSSIPFVGEAVRTVSGFLEGEDVSSGRNNLWRWAIELFRRHPWTGIGWGDYRTTVVGNATLRDELDVHNIYLQLLCENGLLGFSVFVAVFASFGFMTKKLYRFCLNSSDPVFSSLVPFLYFSLAYQLFFLLYGITGNTLYDQHCQIIYFISCGMAVTCRTACFGRAAFLRKQGVAP